MFQAPPVERERALRGPFARGEITQAYNLEPINLLDDLWLNGSFGLWPSVVREIV